MSGTTVVVPCHNYGRFLSWCIQSILHQTKPAREILIIDDDSSDDTENVARSFGSVVKYHKVHFRNAQKTRNYGLATSKSDYLLYLDADDFLDNDALLLMEAELDRDPNLRLIYADRINFGDPELSARLGYPPHWMSKDFSITDLRQHNFISMPSLIRRDCFAGFDERIRLNQDWDAWLSLLESDSHAKRIPRPLYHCRFHGKNKTVNEKELTERLKIMVKHDLLSIIPLSADAELRRVGATRFRGSNIHVLFHQSERSDPLHLEPALEHWQEAKLHLHILTSPDCAADVRFCDALTRRKVRWRTESAMTIEHWLRAFSIIANNDISDRDFVVITDFSTPTGHHLDRLDTEIKSPQLSCSVEKCELLKIQNMEEIHAIAMNGIAIRHLLYFFSPPVGHLRRLSNRLKQVLSRHILWRLQGSRGIPNLFQNTARKV